MPAQLRDSLQKLKASLRAEISDEMRPGPWSLDVHPDEVIPEPYEIEADLERTIKVSTQLLPIVCLVVLKAQHSPCRP